MYVYEVFHEFTRAAINASTSPTPTRVNPIVALIHKGANTQIHDHAINLDSFAITNIIVRMLAIGNPALTACVSLLIVLLN